MLTDVQKSLQVLLTLVVMAAVGAATWRVARVDWGLDDRGRRGADAGPVDALHARKRLTARPLDGAAFRALGGLSASEGDTGAAVDFFRTAARRDPRDALVRINLINIHRASGDEPTAIHHLDALLRVSPALGDPLLRKLLDPMASAGFSDALASDLADDPPWREMLPDAFSEAYRSVRTALQFSTPQGLPRSLLVTSPGPGEGKTTTATELARNIAQLGRRVVLVDADLRSLHSIKAAA